MRLFLPIIAVCLLVASRDVRDDYRDAMEAHPGRAVVLLTQDGCAPCVRLENDLLPLLRQAGMLESTITIISVNRQPKLVRRLHGSEMNARLGYPCLMVFRKKGGAQWGWRRFGYGQPREVLEWLKGIGRWQPPTNKGGK